MNKNRKIFQASQYEHSESRFTSNMILLVVDEIAFLQILLPIILLVAVCKFVYIGMS